MFRYVQGLWGIGPSAPEVEDGFVAHVEQEVEDGEIGHKALAPLVHLPVPIELCRIGGIVACADFAHEEGVRRECVGEGRELEVEVLTEEGQPTMIVRDKAFAFVVEDKQTFDVVDEMFEKGGGAVITFDRAKVAFAPFSVLRKMYGRCRRRWITVFLDRNGDRCATVGSHEVGPIAVTLFAVRLARVDVDFVGMGDVPHVRNRGQKGCGEVDLGGIVHRDQNGERTAPMTRPTISSRLTQT